MYAIIKTGGKQYWISPGQKVRVERLEAKEGEEITLDALWSAGDESKESKIDAKNLSKVKVTAKVLRHVRDPKVIVFKKKAKTGYKKTIGHRQNLTEIQIGNIQQ